jgi:hypothetical protein
MSTHLPSVMRAAERIWTTNEGALTRDRIASIIEAETGLSELLAACENAAHALEATRHMLVEAGMKWGDNMAKDIEIARAAIAKIRKEQA